MLELKTFNALFFALVGITVVFIWLFTHLLKDKSDKTKTLFLTVFCVANIILFFVYKFLLSRDTSFLEASENGFNWFNELPLQLCNINMFLIPLGALTKNRGIMGFSFFMAPFGAIMAILCPEPAFNGYSILLSRMWGFYLTHFMIIISGLLLRTLKLYKPEIKDLPKVFLTIAILGGVITGVNYLIRGLGLCGFANYFFTMGDGGIGLLAFFWNLVKVPYFYLIPAFPILLAYMTIVCGVEIIMGKISEKSVSGAKNIGDTAEKI